VFIGYYLPLSPQLPCRNHLLRLQIYILFFTGRHVNSRGLECEMGQFHWTVDIFQSETILAEFLIRKCEHEGGIVSSIIILEQSAKRI
jgi:hypothetical protein